MSGTFLFALFVIASVASLVLSARAYAAERRRAEGTYTETEMRRWIRKARATWGRSERL